MKRTILWIALGLAVNLPAFAQLQLSQAECRKMALKNNEEMKIAENSYRQAKLDKEIAFAAYLPELEGSLTGIYRKDMDLMGAELQMRGTYLAGLTLTQPIFTGGKIVASNKLAKIGVDCAEESLRKTEMDIIAEADNAYWTYIAVGEKVKQLEAYQKQLDELYHQIAKSVEVQMATQADLLRVDSKRSQILYQLKKAKNGVELCRMSLCSTLGVDIHTTIQATETNIEITSPQQLESSILMRPEYRLLLNQVEAQKQQIKVARADILPTFGISAQYSYYGNLKLAGQAEDGTPFKQEYKDGSPMLMASISVPLFRWGKGLKGIKKAKLNYQNAQLDLQRNERLLNIELQQAIQNIADGYNLVETANIGMSQAAENLRNMQNSYDVSMCTLTDLLDAQAQWQEAYSNQIEAKTQYKIYESEYMRVSGQLKP
ncbi:TolC family protein [Bacteroides faecichinchillae]|uniref:Outer membrane protein TolC n=1 Tax=Bacteroides faecichinchillae TaxID=871325 RepID=A0A1M4YRP6_9BACE|nr:MULTISPECIES: TolC family protein [Bacteroides]THG63513.1 TolC family protein [Bacteroides faecichinchillae]SHF08465.1 Outer membrane protein TolC [Bacteroides faecichinchillae]